MSIKRIFRRLFRLTPLAILGPGLIATAAGNDAGGLTSLGVVNATTGGTPPTRTVTFDTTNFVESIVNDGSIDTGDIAPGATSAAVRMPGSGTHYHCSLHTDMIGAVNASGGTPPPECEGPYCGGIY